MIKGLGTDIIEVSRFLKLMQKHPERFLERLFTDPEKEYCSLYRDSERHFAARFAAKEAVAKALGCGFGKRLNFLDITILNEENGKPVVIFSEYAQLEFSNPHILISLSHCENYATATAIWL